MAECTDESGHRSNSDHRWQDCPTYGHDDADGNPAHHDSQCGTCGATWNSEETPGPSARCPFEYEHEEGGS